MILNKIQPKLNRQLLLNQNAFQNRQVNNYMHMHACTYKAFLKNYIFYTNFKKALTKEDADTERIYLSVISTYTMKTQEQELLDLKAKRIH